MTSALGVQSPADLANVALARIGYADRVGSLYEGSKASKQILDIYVHTRDELLRAQDWGFAERNVVATLLKFAPATGYFPPVVWNPATNPPPPWAFEYVYFDDCLKVRSIKPAPGFLVNFDPQPILFSVENDDNYSPPQKVILCNVPNAIICYTGQITNPVDWDEGYTEAFSATLGRRLAPALMGLEAAKAAAQDEQSADQLATMEQG